jgi:hypothetical protein
VRAQNLIYLGITLVVFILGVRVHNHIQAVNVVHNEILIKVACVGAQPVYGVAW